MPIAIGSADSLRIGGTTIAVLLAVFLLHKEFVAVTLDREMARAMGLRVFWLDILGVSMLAGIGFTVSLLIGDLAFGGGGNTDDHVKVGILVGSTATRLVHDALAKWGASSARQSAGIRLAGSPTLGEVGARSRFTPCSGPAHWVVRLSPGTMAAS